MPYFGSRGSISKIAMPDFGCAAPYPYSKMCELCELLERKIPPLCDGIFLFIRSRIYSSFRGPRKSLIFGERKNDGAIISIHRNPLAKSLLTKTLLWQSRATSWASRRELRGLETRLLWFAMRLLSYLSLPWYKEQNRQVVFFMNKISQNFTKLLVKEKILFNLEKSCYILKNNGLRPIIKILQRPSA